MACESLDLDDSCHFGHVWAPNRARQLCANLKGWMDESGSGEAASALPLVLGISGGVLGGLCLLVVAVVWCCLCLRIQAENKPAAEAARDPMSSSYSNILRRGDMQRDAADSFNKRKEEEAVADEEAALSNPPPAPADDSPREDKAAAARRATQIRESKNIAFDAPPQREPTNLSRTSSEGRFGVLKKQPSMNSVTRPGMQRSNTLKKQASYNNVMARLNNMDPPAPEAKKKKGVEKNSSYGNVLARFQTNDGNEARQMPIVV